MKKSTFGDRITADKSMPFGVNIAAAPDGVDDDVVVDIFWWLLLVFAILLFMMLLLVVIESLVVFIWLLDCRDFELSSVRIGATGGGDWFDLSIVKLFV